MRNGQRPEGESSIATARRHCNGAATTAHVHPSTFDLEARAPRTSIARQQRNGRRRNRQSQISVRAARRNESRAGAQSVIGEPQIDLFAD
jgi:hypothetical protein